MLDVLRQRFLGLKDFEQAVSALDTALERGDSMEILADFYLKYFHQVYDLERVHFPRVNGTPFPAEWKRSLNLGGRDLGIDGIFLRSDDDLVTVQSKFRTDQEVLTYAELATFWSESEHAKYRMVFTNVRNISDVAKRRKGHLFVGREQLEQLEGSFWQAFHDYCIGADIKKQARKLPRDYQSIALMDIERGFQTFDRGKLIAACGIGKTLIALWASEQLEAETTLFLAPNLQLIRQTLNEWAAETSKPFSYIVVCSDLTIDSDLDELSDSESGTDVPVTTDVTEIVAFLQLRRSKRKVVFSTYQSLDALANAIRVSNFSGFDVSISDEAHKTTGIDSAGSFGLALSDDHVPTRKRLFLTATERLFSPRLQAAAALQDRIVFSMDNHALYGPVFHRLSFSEAIRKGIICDYRVVLAIVSRNELREVLADNHYLINADNPGQSAIKTQTLVNLAVTKRLFVDTGVKKLVSYHRSVAEAKGFYTILSQDDDFADKRGKAFWVSGAMSSANRAVTMASFSESEPAVLSNARCLIEGVDIPLIDGVLFASPKNSLIDIVQAVGRALRKPPGRTSEKIAAVVVPVVLESETSAVDVTAPEFDRLYSVIQALRDQDDVLAEEIDQVNLQLATGTFRRQSTPFEGKLQLLIPSEVSLEALSEAITLRIAEVNSERAGTVQSASQLGVGQRTSAHDRNLRTMGDYTPSKYQSSLVDPTLQLMPMPVSTILKSAARINNNNIGHCIKLGVLKQEATKNQLSLTVVGEAYRNGTKTFQDVFRNQMMLYADPISALFPYRVFVEFLLRMGEVKYWDFLFGIYPASSSDSMSGIVDAAVARAAAARALNVSPSIANLKSQEQISDLLFAATGARFDSADVWSDRTTTYNQFRYFRRHLELYDDIFVDNSNVFQFKAGGEAKARTLLTSSLPLLNEAYGSVWWR